MRIAETLQKIKYLPDLGKDTFVLVLLFAVAILGFCAGRLLPDSETKSKDLRVIDAGFVETYGLNPNGQLESGGATAPSSRTASGTQAQTVKGKYVGAKSGKTYYLPWCSGVKRIKEGNKIWFQTADAAAAKGYTPSTSCKGM
jgi:hypothetical protein